MPEILIIEPQIQKKALGDFNDRPYEFVSGVSIKGRVKVRK